MYRKPARALALLGALLGACDAPEEEPGLVREAAIYGEDDRPDVFEHPNAALSGSPQGHLPRARRERP